jgi:hypothetical protein
MKCHLTNAADLVARRIAIRINVKWSHRARLQWCDRTRRKGLLRINQDKSHHIPSLLLSSISSDKALYVLYVIAIEHDAGR